MGDKLAALALISERPHAKDLDGSPHHPLLGPVVLALGASSGVQLPE